MRPRVFPAEDIRVLSSPSAGVVASMRPRVFPAEDRRRASIIASASSASMRPRVFPAEDQPGRYRIQVQRRRFNEAAGIPRGRRDDQQRARPARGPASMRPRVFPAEDTSVPRYNVSDEIVLQ